MGHENISTTQIYTHIVDEQIHNIKEDGKNKIWIDNKNKIPLLLNVSLVNDKSTNEYFIIKYSNQNIRYKSRHFYYDNQTIQYYSIEKTVESQWDTIKDNFKDNST